MEKAMDTQIEIVETIYGRFYTPVDELVTRQLKLYSAHTRNEIAMLISVIREQDVILDIGAHIGTFSIPIAKSHNKNVRIFAFEPQSNVFNLLCKNVQVNDLEEQIQVLNGIVSDRKKELFQCVPSHGNSMAVTFLPIDKADVAESSQAEESQNTNIYVIDEMLRNGNIPSNVNVVKIDTEGAEVKVLNSCMNLIKSNYPVIYGEINVTALEKFSATSDDIENILSPLGYHFFRNTGNRNSTDDSFKISRLKHLQNGGNFFDFLAIHSESERYPEYQQFYNQSSMKNIISRKTRNFWAWFKKGVF